MDEVNEPKHTPSGDVAVLVDHGYVFRGDIISKATPWDRWDKTLSHGERCTVRFQRVGPIRVEGPIAYLVPVLHDLGLLHGLVEGVTPEEKAESAEELVWFKSVNTKMWSVLAACPTRARALWVKAGYEKLFGLISKENKCHIGDQPPEEE